VTFQSEGEYNQNKSHIKCPPIPSRKLSVHRSATVNDCVKVLCSKDNLVTIIVLVGSHKQKEKGTSKCSDFSYPCSSVSLVNVCCRW